MLQATTIAEAYSAHVRKEKNGVTRKKEKEDECMLVDTPAARFTWEELCGYQKTEMVGELECEIYLL